MEFFLSAFVMFVVIIDPPGVAAVYAALTGGHAPLEARKVAKKAVIIATLVLVAFGFVGAWLLQCLGITLEAFRIAGGLLLFVIAFRMLMGQPEPRMIEDNASAYQTRENIAVFPLAIPLLAGPGCMTAMILLSGKALDVGQHILVFVAMGLAMGCAWISLAFATRITRVLGKENIEIIARLMGILLAALAVQFIVDGVKGMF
jgi:multiple antibiotic resistance protein